MRLILSLRKLDLSTMSNRRKKQRKNLDTGRLCLWPIGWALATCFTVAAIGLGSLAWGALALLHYPKLPHASAISLHDLVSVLQLVFASVAGAGALVALVMAYRRQRVAEANSTHDRTRVFNERFIAIAQQFGDDQPAVRLAGVHAMAGLADDWGENRQACIDVLCAYLRMPYKPDPGEGAVAEDRLVFASMREVRHTIVRIITAHLTDYAKVSWQGYDFDFTGVVFDGGSFANANFINGDVSFKDAKFSDVGFMRVKFCSELSERGYSGVVSFVNAKFVSGMNTFHGSEFSSLVLFGGAKFTGGYVAFNDVKFTGGEVGFATAEFSGGEVDFTGAEFSGAEVDFSHVGNWSHPPVFTWETSPPSSVKLPPL